MLGDLGLSFHISKGGGVVSALLTTMRMKDVKLLQGTEPSPMYVEAAIEGHGAAKVTAGPGVKGWSSWTQGQGAKGCPGEPKQRAPGLRGDGTSLLTLMEVGG